MATSYCNGQLCKRKFGAIENKAYTAAGESMFDFGYCRCRICNCYYLAADMKEKRITMCLCCRNFLRFKPTTRIRRKKKEDTILLDIDIII